MSTGYSVAMAAYNGEKFIETQITSIIQQKIPPEEIVIVDDASTDSTPEIIENIKKKTKFNIIIERHKENMGYRSSFFEAISKTSCPVVFLSDQDDIWKENKSSEILSLIEKNDKILAVNTNYELIDGDGDIIRETALTRRKEYRNEGSAEIVTAEDIINYNTAMGCTMAVTEPLIGIIKEHGEFLRELSIPHDWAVNFIAAKLGGLFYFNKKLISYRLHGGNTLGLDRADSIKSRIDAYEDIRVQKADMEKINAGLFEDDSKTRNYISDLDKCYKNMIDALRKKSLFSYFKAMKNGKRFFSNKTFLYDIYLICKPGSSK